MQVFSRDSQIILQLLVLKSEYTHNPVLARFTLHVHLSYPTDNCFAIYGGSGSPHNYQDEFINFLTHDGAYSGRGMLNKFLNASSIAQTANKPMIMFETNTASCGGFPGASNSFAAALWGVDYGMALAYSNFSHGLLHCGGQDVFYNVSPPSSCLVSTSP